MSSSDKTSPAEVQAKPRRPGRPRLRDQAGSAPDLILKVALEEFGHNGFEGTNIAEIAKRAGVAKPLVHYHFESKEKLWQAAIMHAMAKLTTEFSTLHFEVRDLEPMAILSVVIRRFTYFCARNHAMTNVVIQEITRGTERGIWLTDHFIKPTFLMAETFLKSAMQKNELKPVHPGPLLSMISGAINGYFAFSGMLSELYGFDPLDEKAASDHAELVVDVILNGIRARPPA